MKKLLISLLAVALLLLPGCEKKEFESVLPPTNTYPTAGTLEEIEVTQGELVIEKSFFGNKRNNTELYLLGSVRGTESFVVGEKGYVTLTYRGQELTLPATLTACPDPEIGSGDFIATFKANTTFPDLCSGKFWVVIKTIPQCTMVSRFALLILDDEGNALAQKLNADGTLTDVPVKVGDTNGEVYQVLSGLNPGDKVVKR